MQHLQLDSNNPQEKPISPYIWITAAVLAIAAVIATKFPVVFYFLLFGVGVFVLVTRYRDGIDRMKEARAVASAYANLCGPQVICATRPDESLEELELRAQDYRQKLRDSGNPYWSDLPIYIEPYQVMIAGAGRLTLSFDEYRMRCYQKQYDVNVKWVEDGPPALAKLRAAFAVQVFGALRKEETANQNQGQAI